MTKFKVGQRVQCVKSWLGKIEAVRKDKGNEKPIKHYQLKDIVNFDFENHTANIIQNICAQVIDNTDKVIVDVIIKAAKENGITDLYLMDKKFVLDALLEKAEREKGCEYCAGYEVETFKSIIEMSENHAVSLDVDEIGRASCRERV